MSVGQVSGLVSGLDTKSLIDALITARSRPIALLQQRQAQKTAELAAWKSLETILLSLKIGTGRLADGALWKQLSVATSDEDHISVDAGTSAPTGSWDLFVEQLAVAHQEESQAYASRDALVGEGTLVLGTPGGTREIEVGAGTTLSQLADLVNEADAGVRAMLVRSTAGGVESFRLVLTATESGEANRFTVDASGVLGGTAPAFTTARTGDDAVLRFGGEGGTEIRSSTNLFQDIVQGIDVTVLRVHDPGDRTSVSVDRDVDGLEAAIGQFVDGYNALIDFVNTQNKFDAESGTRPPLLGSGQLSSILADVRARVVRPIAGTENATFRTLRAVGLRAAADGRLEFDTADFRDALAGDFDAVANLFRVNAAVSGSGVEWLSAPDGADLSGRQVRVEVTTAATRANVRGDLVDLASGITIDDTNDSFRISIDGTRSDEIHVAHGTYTDGHALAAALAKAIDDDDALGALTVGVTFEPDAGSTGRLVFTSSRWGSKGTLTLNNTGSSFASAVGLTSVINRTSQGADAAGTIDGRTAVGDGRRLSLGADDGDLGGIVFQVTATEGEVPFGVDVSFTEGLGRAATRRLAQLTDPADGVLRRLSDSIRSMLDRYALDIQAKQDQLERRRANLEAQYARLESTLSELSGQGQFVSAQIQALRGGSTSSTSR